MTMKQKTWMINIIHSIGVIIWCAFELGVNTLLDYFVFVLLGLVAIYLANYLVTPFLHIGLFWLICKVKKLKVVSLRAYFLLITPQSKGKKVWHTTDNLIYHFDNKFAPKGDYEDFDQYFWELQAVKRQVKIVGTALVIIFSATMSALGLPTLVLITMHITNLHYLDKFKRSTFNQMGKIDDLVRATALSEQPNEEHVAYLTEHLLGNLEETFLDAESYEFSLIQGWNHVIHLYGCYKVGDKAVESYAHVVQDRFIEFIYQQTDRVKYQAIVTIFAFFEAKYWLDLTRGHVDPKTMSAIQFIITQEWRYNRTTDWTKQYDMIQKSYRGGGVEVDDIQSSFFFKALI